MTVSLNDIDKIIKLSKKSKTELRKKNDSDGRAYTGKGLTKNMLIFQIVFNMDAPVK